MRRAHFEAGAKSEEVEKRNRRKGTENSRIYVKGVTFEVSLPSIESKRIHKTQQTVRRRRMMDKEKFEKMAEMMRGYYTDEEGLANCCSMMRKMMQLGEKKETEKKKKDSEKTE